MTALSDTRINQGRLNGVIVIEPFDPANLGSASYDVRLGDSYYRANKRKQSYVAEHLNTYNIYAEYKAHVWNGPFKARACADYKAAYPKADWSNINDDDRIVMLEPHDNLLCHTIEFIGARRQATTMMKARSSIGRSLVNVCQCAGMGDIGYVNRWTMEVYNRSDFYIPLVVGRRIAQIVFLHTGFSDSHYNSKYQTTNDIERLKQNWNPSDMLPKLHLDRDIKRQAGTLNLLNNPISFYFTDDPDIFVTEDGRRFKLDPLTRHPDWL